MVRTEAIQVWRGHKGAVYDLTWDSERRAWLSAGGDGVVAAWLPGEEHGTAVFQHASPFYAVSMWGGATVGGNSNGSLFTAEGTEVRQFDVHKGPVLALGTSQSGLHVSGDAYGLLCLWSAEGGRLEMQHACATTFGKIRHIAPHPEGMLLATGSGQVVVMSNDGKVVSAIQAHTRSGYWASIHPTKSVTLSTGQDGELVVHDGHQEVLSMPVHKSAVYRGWIDGELLWTAGRDHDVKAWDLNTFDSVHKLHMPHNRSVNALTFGGGEGGVLATAGDDRAVKIWRVNSASDHQRMGAPPQD